MTLVAIQRTCGLKMQLGTPLPGGKQPYLNVLVRKELFFGVWRGGVDIRRLLAWVCGGCFLEFIPLGNR